MVRVSSPAKLRPWSELIAKMVMGVVPGLVKLFSQQEAAGVVRGNTIRGNTTRNSERKMAL